MIRFIAFVTLLFVTTFTFAQKEKVILVTFKKKILEKQVDDKLILKKRRDLQNKLQDVEFSLLFNKNISIFQVVETLQSDFNKLNNSFAQTIGGTELTVVTNLNSNKKYYSTILFNEPYIVHDPLNNLNWQIKKETKDILGYNCLKATTLIKIDDFRGKQEFEVICWFTKEIPSSFGPSTFNGLPGTILEMQYGDIITYADKIRTKTFHITIPNIEGKKVSSKEYISIFNEKMIAFGKN